MKLKFLFPAVLLIFSVFSCGLFASGTTDGKNYNIEDTGISFDLYDTFSYVFTKEESIDDAVLTEWGIDKEDIFVNDSVVLVALTEDQSYELVVTISESDWSSAYDSFAELTDEEIQSLTLYALDSLDSLNDSEIETEYGDVELFRGEQGYKYIKAWGTLSGEGIEGKVIQYVTVVNGAAYTFTFNNYGSDFTDEQENFADQTVSSVVIADSQGNGGNNDIIYAIIIGVLVVVILVLLYVIRKQKKENENNKTDKNGEVL